MTTFPVIFAITDDYSRPLAVLLASLLENSKSGAAYEFIVLHSSVNEKNQALLHTLCRRYKNAACRFLDMRPVIGERDLRKYLSPRDNYTYIPVETYYRFFIPEIFPQYDKVLYLDADMLVLDDLGGIIAEDVSDVYVGAVRDCFMANNILRGRRPETQPGWTFHTYLERRLGMRADRYFNTGLLLLNLQAMRRDNITEKLWDFVNAESPLEFQDQDALNAVLGSRVKLLEDKWNVFGPMLALAKRSAPEKQRRLLAAYEHPAVFHFVGRDKPWLFRKNGDFNFPFITEWWHYYSLTPFYRKEDLGVLEAILFQKCKNAGPGWLLRKIAGKSARIARNALRRVFAPHAAAPKRNAVPSSMERLVDKLYRKYVSETDRVLLDCVFSPAPTQAMLDECLRVCDIEAMGAHKSLLLSYLMQDHPELKFSDYAGPRLRGLIQFFRFANMKTLAHFSRIGKALNRANIPMLLFKGGAMKVLRPGLSRPMGDVDVLIPAERLDEAVRLCEGLGYLHYREESNHAVDFHTENESAVDVHYAVFDPGRDYSAFHRALFARGRERAAFGVHFLLPCHEDLFFLVLANFTKNLREHTTLHGLFYALADSRFLLKDKADFNWSLVREDAKNSGHELEVKFAAEFLNAIAAGTVPDADRHFPLTPGMKAFCNQVIFDEDFFLPKQHACQAIRVLDLKHHPRLYSTRIARFLLLKKLRHIPAFVDWYLRTRLPQPSYLLKGADSAR